MFQMPDINGIDPRRYTKPRAMIPEIGYLGMVNTPNGSRAAFSNDINENDLWKKANIMDNTGWLYLDPKNLPSGFNDLSPWTGERDKALGNIPLSSFQEKQTPYEGYNFWTQVALPALQGTALVFGPMAGAASLADASAAGTLGATAGNMATNAAVKFGEGQLLNAALPPEYAALGNLALNFYDPAQGLMNGSNLSELPPDVSAWADQYGIPAQDALDIINSGTYIPGNAGIAPITAPGVSVPTGPTELANDLMSTAGVNASYAPGTEPQTVFNPVTGGMGSSVSTPETPWYSNIPGATTVANGLSSIGNAIDSNGLLKAVAPGLVAGGLGYLNTQNQNDLINENNQQNLDIWKNSAYMPKTVANTLRSNAYATSAELGKTATNNFFNDAATRGMRPDSGALSQGLSNIERGRLQSLASDLQSITKAENTPMFAPPNMQPNASAWGPISNLGSYMAGSWFNNYLNPNRNNIDYYQLAAALRGGM